MESPEDNIDEMLSQPLTEGMRRKPPNLFVGSMPKNQFRRNDEFDKKFEEEHGGLEEYNE